MDHIAEIARNLMLAWAAGTLIGIERSSDGRAAGFRTHGLVALAAAATALVSFEPMFFADMRLAPHLDASRLSQGVMTGIGFLGAGVIFKEGLSVQGLTTAASIWACAAVGFLFGLGMWQPAGLVTLAIFVTLTLFRWIEDRTPWRVYAYAVFRFEPDAMPPQAAFPDIIGDKSLKMEAVSYCLTHEGRLFEMTANLDIAPRTSIAEVARRLRGVKGLVEFDLSRISK